MVPASFARKANDAGAPDLQASGDPFDHPQPRRVFPVRAPGDLHAQTLLPSDCSRSRCRIDSELIRVLAVAGQQLQHCDQYFAWPSDADLCWQCIWHGLAFWCSRDLHQRQHRDRCGVHNQAHHLRSYFKQPCRTDLNIEHSDQWQHLCNGACPAVASGPFAAIFPADIPTGTTATIALTYNSSVFNDQTLTVYSVDDALLVSTTPNTGNGTASAATTASTSSLTQTAGGFTLAGAGTSTGVTSLAVTGYTTDQNGGTGNVITAHLALVSSTGSAAATATWSTSASAAIVVASWR
jgi:hypothetical protein